MWPEEDEYMQLIGLDIGTTSISAAVLDALIQKKCRGELTDPGEIKRVSDGLLRRGFGWSEVRSALSRYAELAED